MPIFDRNGREVIRILDDQGREIETVYDQNGVIVYTNAVTIIGTSPIQFKAFGLPLKDYRIYGETLQDGTPSPDMPVDVVGCGVKTGNVMPAGEKKTVEVNGVTFSSDGNGRYHISGTASQYSSVQFNLASGFTTPTSVSNGGQGTLSFFNDKDCLSKVRLVFYNGTTEIDDWGLSPINRTNTAYNTIGNKYVDSIKLTVEAGTTVDMTTMPEFTNDGILPPEFEPYGYKLPLTVNGTEYPIYLGQVQTTRKIKKLVLTGEEEFGAYDYNSKRGFWLAGLIGKYTRAQGLCTHYPVYNGTSYDDCLWIGVNDSILYFIGIGTKMGITKPEEFQSYLAQQYAAGTPVTIWYVLAEPETGIVNEPLHKIGNYADTISFAQAGVTIPTVPGSNVLDVPTEVPPSEIDLTGRLKTSG